MNKATREFKQLISTYLNDNLFGDFEDNLENKYNDNCYIVKPEEAGDDLHHELDSQRGDLSTADELDPFGEKIFKRYCMLKQHVKKSDDYLTDLDEDSLVIFDSDNDKVKLLTTFDLDWIKSELAVYLENDSPLKFRIKWILKHKSISDYALGRKVKMSHVQINLFKRGKRNIGNMTLNNAIRINNYYCSFIDSKLY